jgi:hypothetical protein
MTIQVQLVLTALDGRGSTHQIHDTIITPDFIAAIPISSHFAHLTTTPAYNPSENLLYARADTQTLDVVSY